MKISIIGIEGASCGVRSVGLAAAPTGTSSHPFSVIEYLHEKRGNSDSGESSRVATSNEDYY